MPESGPLSPQTTPSKKASGTRPTLTLNLENVRVYLSAFTSSDDHKLAYNSFSQYLVSNYYVPDTVWALRIPTPHTGQKKARGEEAGRVKRGEGGEDADGGQTVPPASDPLRLKSKESLPLVAKFNTRPQTTLNLKAPSPPPCPDTARSPLRRSCTHTLSSLQRTDKASSSRSH